MHYFLISNSPDSDPRVLCHWPNKAWARKDMKGQDLSYMQIRKAPWPGGGKFPSIQSMKVITIKDLDGDEDPIDMGTETYSIPDKTWQALLSLGLSTYKSYRAWQIIRSSEDYSEVD